MLASVCCRYTLIFPVATRSYSCFYKSFCLSTFLVCDGHEQLGGQCHRGRSDLDTRDSELVLRTWDSPSELATGSAARDVTVTNQRWRRTAAPRAFSPSVGRHHHRPRSTQTPVTAVLYRDSL